MEQIPTDFIQFERLLARGNFRKALALYRGPLAPLSESPFIIQHRAFLEETLVSTILNQGDMDLLIELSHRVPDDLAVLEEILTRVPSTHSAYPYLLAKYNFLKTEYNM